MSYRNFILYPLIMLLFISPELLSGQVKYTHKNKVTINGKVYSTAVINGDTVIIADLDSISISSPRTFATKEEYQRYRKYKYFAPMVYPYAKDAINILNKLEERTKDMPPAKRRRYIKLTYRQLEHNFKKKLKSLSKTQGKILIKMIEKETNMTFYNLIKKMRNGFVAFYWHQFGKLYGYDLKEGYIRGKDKPMDAVLDDFKFDDNDDKMLNIQIMK